MYKYRKASLGCKQKTITGSRWWLPGAPPAGRPCLFTVDSRTAWRLDQDQ